MQNIPLQAVPSQTFTVTVSNQSCVINVYQTLYGLFMDLYSNGTLVVGGVICQNLNRIVRSLYLGFTGDFCFYDTQGTNGPDYTGLGTRYLLVYLATTDLAVGEG